MFHTKINRKTEKIVLLVVLALPIFLFFGLNSVQALNPGTNLEVCVDEPTKGAPYANVDDPFHPILFYAASGSSGFWYYHILIYRVSDGLLMFDSGAQYPLPGPPPQLAGNCTWDFPVPANTLPVDGSQYRYLVALYTQQGDWTPFADGYFYLYADGLCGRSDINNPTTYGGTYCPGALPSVTVPDLCLNGQATPVEITGGTGPSDPWKWICHGAGGADSPQCLANVNEILPGLAGVELTREICPPGTISTVDHDLCTQYDSRYPPSANLTGNGTESNPWTWTCSQTCSTGPNQGTTYSRTYSPKINALCGSASSKNFCTRYSEPNINDLCLPVGSDATDRVQTYNEWTWTCSGQCGGTSASCRAGNYRSCGWTETNPQ